MHKDAMAFTKKWQVALLTFGKVTGIILKRVGIRYPKGLHA